MHTTKNRMKQLLKQALPPMNDAEPARDLWPAVRQRLEAWPAAPPWIRLGTCRWARGLCACLPGVDPRVSLLPVNPRTCSPQKARIHEHPSLSTRISGRRLCADSGSAAYDLSDSSLLRLGLQIPVPIERGLMFPMALVPIPMGRSGTCFGSIPTRVHIWRSDLMERSCRFCDALRCGAGQLPGHPGIEANGITWFQSLHVPYASCAVFPARARSLLPCMEIHRWLLESRSGIA